MREYQFEIAPAPPYREKLTRDSPELSYNPPSVLSLLQTCPVAVKFSVSNAAYPPVPSVFADSSSTK
jgi:hypothetical protein